MTIRILLVDDNQTFLTAVRNFLFLLPNVEVVAEAHDGKTALAMAERYAPDLVLLDIVMPQMNGLEVAAKLKDFAHPPHVVFLSMHDNESYRSAARELGALGYVGKGDFVVTLIPLIDRLCSEMPAQQDTAVTAPGAFQ